ncbi:MAG: TraB/GumN family protein [Deltaproteobacteria bacterium]|nr:TraB/GumN family protein [Deltaproteobacteria bacterium]MBW1928305.1 TraB/GumN family protein [Deltaproteobacteria bacterium]MBW2025023.1 TraB/GumN family protein [Deltaproteobacteria bacterium]MBW2124484.1 TraB/GumN family protein [Deltaproteobacteria bacterium]RLB21974.1 MAG: TraB family protein [Deltaproteobacteria bacterium]
MAPDNHKNIERIETQEKTFILVGTAHVSRESAELVRNIIHEEHPDTVCVELCSSRFETLTKKKQWEETDLLKVIKEKKAFLLLSNFVLSSFQKKIGDKLGVRPGQEVLEAIQAAQTLGAHIHLADRDIRITLSRTWRLMSFWTKIKLLGQFFTSASQLESIREEEIEKMKELNVVESLIAEVAKSLPEVGQVLIDERDQYLSQKIRNAPGQKIVAVVGAGHLPGIRKYWDKEIDLSGLESLPPKSKWVTALKWLIPILILALITTGFLMAGTRVGTHMLKWWVLANAVLSGLGAAAALGHPLTVLSAIIAAPITSLNPMVAAGWVAGVVEVFCGRPKVKDFQALSQDLGSLKGFWKNKVTRILLVVVLTNIGSSLGTFVAIPLMLKVLSHG